jgi:hypothetical protein
MKSLSPGSIANLSNPSEIQPVLAFGRRHSAWRFTIRSAAPTDYFDSHEPFAIALDGAGLCSFSLESSMQSAQRHSVDPAELALR